MAFTLFRNTSTSIPPFEPIPSSDPAVTPNLGSSPATEFVYQNADGSFTRVIGFGFTYAGNGAPTGGTVTQIQHTADAAGATIYATISPSTGVDSLATMAGFLFDRDGSTADVDLDGLGAYLFSQSDVMVTFDNDGTDWAGEAGDDTLVGGGGSDFLTGEDGNDTLLGRGGNDSLFGDAGVDTLQGGSGIDFLDGGAGEDILTGGFGVDNLNGGSEDDILLGGNGDDTLNGDAGADFLRGNANNDVLNGGDGDDTLRGGNGADNLFGDAGIDNIEGGPGQDNLTGGLDADIFRMSDMTHSPVATADVFTDFSGTSGGQGDRIELYYIDANTTLAGNQDFGPLTTTGLVAFGLNYNTGTGSLEGDVNGDAAADFRIVLSGAPTLVDFDIIG